MGSRYNVALWEYRFSTKMACFYLPIQDRQPIKDWFLVLHVNYYSDVLGFMPGENNKIILRVNGTE